MSLSDRLRRLGVQVSAGPSYKLRPELLLHPQIPKPMHGMAPRVVLGTAWWNRERQESYRRAEFHCQACGVSKHAAAFHQWLEGHEIYDVDYVRGRMTYVECVALCHSCHSFIHAGRLQALRDKGEISQHKFDAVHRHGETVLRMAGLNKAEHEAETARQIIRNGGIAEWGDWRLVVNGKEHEPLYKSFEEWEEAMR